MSSVPLSLMIFGPPRLGARLASSRTTRRPEIAASTTAARHSRDVVDDVEHAEPLPRDELVVNELEAPALVGNDSTGARPRPSPRRRRRLALRPAFPKPATLAGPVARPLGI